MTRINLLPPEIKGKAEKVNLAPWIAIAFLVVVVVLGGLWVLFHSQVSSKESDLKSEQQTLSDLQKQVEEPLKRYEEQAAQLQDIQDLYAACNSGRIGWASMLNDLALYVPEGLTTATNKTAPAIWLTSLNIDATSLEGAATATPGMSPPIVIRGYAAPAWLCIQTWLPRASDFKAHGFLDAYPYYYYFRGQPKVAEFYVRLHNMEEWSNLWISRSTQEIISYNVPMYEYDDQGNRTVVQEQASDWAINFEIMGYWDIENAPWELKSTTGAEDTGTTTGTGEGTTAGNGSTGGGEE